MKQTYILDACALIAMLREEHGMDIVVRLLERASRREISLLISKVNLLEVYYDTYKQAGRDRADKVLAEIKRSPIRIINEVSDRVLQEAGRLKVSYKVSLADAFALAEAVTRDGVLVTADHHEFDVVEMNEPIQFLWFR